MRIDPGLGMLQDLRAACQHALRALHGRLTLADNLQCVVVSVSDTGLANVAFTVDHNLGRVPTIYQWNIDRAGIIYDSTRASWTTTQMTLKCSVANAAVTLVIF